MNDNNFDIIQLRLKILIARLERQRHAERWLRDMRTLMGLRWTDWQ